MTPDADLNNQLIAQARALADERSWPFLEPIEVSESTEGGEPVWTVRSNYLARGRNVRIVLRKSDLSVVRSAYLPR
jgi:hypothetical protein